MNQVIEDLGSWKANHVLDKVKINKVRTSAFPKAIKYTPLKDTHLQLQPLQKIRFNF